MDVSSELLEQQDMTKMRTVESINQMKLIDARKIRKRINKKNRHYASPSVIIINDTYLI